MKKTILLLTLLIGMFQVTQAQKIKFKKGVVSVDGIPVMNYESDVQTTELTSLDDKNTILLKNIRESEYTNGEVYSKITFAEQKKSLTSKSYIFTRKALIKKLLKNKIIDADGNFNPSKIDKFIMKYDEKIESPKTKEIRIIVN